MRKIILTFLVLVVLVSCGSTKNVTPSKSTKTVTKAEGLKTFESDFSGKISKEMNAILQDSEKYLGVPYKYGGNTTSGLDCSGFVCKVYEENEIKLPRRSADQALQGKEISVSEIKPGDLVFFATSGGTKVSHVGIVHTINKDGEIVFIHASTSKGVILSSLNEKYWNKAFLFARRVL